MIDMKAEVNGLNEKVVKMLAERKMTVQRLKAVQEDFLRHL